MMIHQPLGGFSGQATDIDIHAREILLIRDQLNQILSRHTGQPVEKIALDTERDNFMGGHEAVEYGLIDRVLEERGPIDKPAPDRAHPDKAHPDKPHTEKK